MCPTHHEEEQKPLKLIQDDHCATKHSAWNQGPRRNGGDDGGSDIDEASGALKHDELLKVEIRHIFHMTSKEAGIVLAIVTVPNEGDGHHVRQRRHE